MSKTKKLPKYVTYQTLAQFAKAADATFALRLNAMEERLRAEFEPRYFGGNAQVSEPFTEADAIRLADEIEAEQRTYEGNHLAPTPAEGAE